MKSLRCPSLKSPKRLLPKGHRQLSWPPKSTAHFNMHELNEMKWKIQSAICTKFSVWTSVEGCREMQNGLHTGKEQPGLGSRDCRRRRRKYCVRVIVWAVAFKLYVVWIKKAVVISECNGCHPFDGSMLTSIVVPGRYHDIFEEHKSTHQTGATCLDASVPCWGYNQIETVPVLLHYDQLPALRRPPWTTRGMETYTDCFLTWSRIQTYWNQDGSWVLTRPSKF